MKARVPAALLLALAAGCSDEPGPLASEGAAAFLPCLFGSGLKLEVGEVVQFTGAQGEILCLDAATGSESNDFTLVPFFASPNGEARLRVTALGGNVQRVSASLAATGEAAGPGLRAVVESHEMHMRLRERADRAFRALRRAGPAPAAGLAPTGRSALADPVVGDVVQLNVPDFDRAGVSPCDARNPRSARVVAVTRRAVIVHDLLNPEGGFSDAEYRAFGERFDDTVFPVDSATFGMPSDIDATGGRVVIFFTKAVNDLTPPAASGYIGGFFWAGDLIPPRGTPRYSGCQFSNASEIFYVLVPDPVRGGSFDKANVQRGAIGTLAHEMEHLINASRRIYVRDVPLEEIWLDEGLAHIAEELVFYRVSGLGPRQNLNRQQLEGAGEATDTYILDNLGRYLTYLEQPDSNSLLGEDRLPTRGATWAFLRYAADREPGPDQAFFFNLVNTDRVGVANVSALIGADAVDWMQDWTLAVYTDDVVPGMEARHQQPSWNFRSVMPRVSQLFGGRNVFPLRVVRVGTETPTQVNLRGGGAAFFRFGVLAGGRVGVSMDTPSRDVAPEDLRISIVRTR